MAIDIEFIEPDTPPSSSDVVNFRTRSDAFVAFIASFVTKLIAFVTQINSTEANINAKEASTVAASNIAIALANYKGIFVQGTSSALVGESWSYSGLSYRCAVDTSNNPITEPGSWVSLAIDAMIHASPAENPGGTDEFGFWDSFTLQLRRVSLTNLISIITNGFAPLASPAFTTGATIDGASVATEDYVGAALGQVLSITYTAPDGTNGFSAVSGVRNTIPLNTVQLNTIPGASLTGGRPTLPAGKYTINASCTTDNNGSAQLLWHNPATLYLLNTSIGSIESTYAARFKLNLHGAFVLSAETELELAFRCTVTNSIGTALATTGFAETYANLLIQKVG